MQMGNGEREPPNGQTHTRKNNSGSNDRSVADPPSLSAGTYFEYALVQARSPVEGLGTSHRPGQYAFSLKPAVRGVASAQGGGERCPCPRSHTLRGVGSCAGQLEHECWQAQRSGQVLERTRLLSCPTTVRSERSLGGTRLLVWLLQQVWLARLLLVLRPAECSCSTPRGLPHTRLQPRAHERGNQALKAIMT